MRGSGALAVLALGGVALGAATWYASRNQGEGGGWALPDVSGALDAVDSASGALIAEAAPAVYSVIDAVLSAPGAQEYGAMNQEANVRAFLRMIRICEVGTDGERGYRTLFGGGTFDSYAQHPGVAGSFTMNVNGSAQRVTSTAAGAYQFLAGTWSDAQRALGLPDFSPASQDEAALWLLRRRGALADVRAGNFQSALTKAGREWASLPGSPYGQPVKSLDQVMAYYVAGGGDIAGGVMA